MDFSAYVGLPFKERGRDRAGLDCWGLLRVFYAEQLGIDLPSFADDYATTADRVALSDLMAGNMEPWREVPAGGERPGDGLLLRMAGAESHVGVVAGRGTVLHIERGAGAVIESYRDSRLRRRVVGFFRHEAAA